MIKRTRGFSLLEVMLAALVLMVGIMGVAQLNRSLFSGLDPSQDHGVNQQPAIVENLLRDQVERARSAQPPAPVADLVTQHGTYSLKVNALGGAEAGVRLTRQRYEAVVHFQAVGRTEPEAVVAGRVIFDTVTGGAPGAGL